MGLMEQFADPAAFQSLSLADKMTGSLVTMLMGMGVTFLVLAILWSFVVALGKALNRKDQTEAEETEGKGKDDQDEREIITAVIAATVAAYEEDGGTGDLVVKRIRRISTGRKIEQ